MEILRDKDGEFILISETAQVAELVARINEQVKFAYRFKFSDRDFFVDVLTSLGINYDDFTVKYYYYDHSRKLHIAESEFEYVWISTAGLVAKSKSTTNSAVNACLNQHTVISLLLEKAIEVVSDEKVYDIDSHLFGRLTNLSPAIFHNLTFYVEVFCKAYLSLTGVQPPHTHKLQAIYQATLDTMNSNKHDDSLLQVLLLEPLYKFVEHINSIPGAFKEHFIKYDDNPDDDTVILFELRDLLEMKNLLDQSADFIGEYFYTGAQTHYLQTNLYQTMLDKAGTVEKKKRIQELYPHLAKKNSNT